MGGLNRWVCARVLCGDVRGQLGGEASPIGGNTVPMVWDPVLNKKGNKG